MTMMTIGEAAARSGVTAKTIRFYEEIGLLAAAPRAANGYRAYGEKEVRTLEFVSRARALGFSLQDIAGLLKLYRDRGRASQEVKTIAQAHIAELDRRIAELSTIRAALGDLVEHCHGDDRPHCPILDELAAPEG
jgi:MerR family transcriptional regulator, copper efflux regulator